MVGGLCILEAGPLSPALHVYSAAIEQYQVTTVINFSLNWAWLHFACTITYTLDRLKKLIFEFPLCQVVLSYPMIDKKCYKISYVVFLNFGTPTHYLGLCHFVFAEI